MEAARWSSIRMQLDGPMVRIGCRRLANSELVACLKTVVQAYALRMGATAGLFLSTVGPTLLLPDNDADFKAARRSVSARSVLAQLPTWPRARTAPLETTAPRASQMPGSSTFLPQAGCFVPGAADPISLFTKHVSGTAVSDTVPISRPSLVGLEPLLSESSCLVEQLKRRDSHRDASLPTNGFTRKATQRHQAVPANYRRKQQDSHASSISRPSLVKFVRKHRGKAQVDRGYQVKVFVAQRPQVRLSSSRER
jgi:hypothetical protein